MKCVLVKLRSLSAAVVVMVLLVSAAPAQAQIFYRTNTDSFDHIQLSATAYISLANLADGTFTGPVIDLEPDLHTATQIFFDGSSFYQTQENGGIVNQIFRFASLADLSTQTDGEEFDLTAEGFPATWNLSDTFLSDGTYYYRNGTVDDVTPGTVRYNSFADLVSDTGGTYFEFSTPYALTDRFFALDGKFYRTYSSGPSVAGFDIYANFTDLINGTVEQQMVSTAGWALTDRYFAVPEPALAGLLLVAAPLLIGWLRFRQTLTSKH